MSVTKDRFEHNCLSLYLRWNALNRQDGVQRVPSSENVLFLCFWSLGAFLLLFLFNHLVLHLGVCRRVGKGISALSVMCNWVITLFVLVFGLSFSLSYHLFSSKSFLPIHFTYYTQEIFCNHFLFRYVVEFKNTENWIGI